MITLSFEAILITFQNFVHFTLTCSMKIKEIPNEIFDNLKNAQKWQKKYFKFSLARKSAMGVLGGASSLV